MKYEEFAALANRFGYKINHHSTTHMEWPDGESIEGHKIERRVDGANGASDESGELYINEKKSTIEDLENYFQWDMLLQKIPLLNRAELCRRADVPKSRLVDAERGRCKIREDDLAKLWAVVDSLSR